ncbi:MAG: sugar phosphate isomerase/epimerase [Firmicutes bacterium]|nr:sugar phosphate isomerase/epimerase [Bacillota bacterium]
MKFSYTVATPDTKSPDVLAFRGDFRESLAALKELGYDGVELMVRSPRELDQEAIKKALEEFALEVPDVCTGEVFGIDRLSFMDPDPAVRREAVQRTKEVIDFADLLDSQINVGRLRGSFRPGVDRADSLKWAREAFSEVLEYAAAKDVRVLLEPVNRYEINFLCSTQEALEFVAAFNNPYFGLMLDVYHMNIEDKSIIASFIEAIDYCYHIHFADATRRYPGTGQIDFLNIMRALKALKYDGFISLEVMQKPDQYTAASRSIEYLRLLDELS